MRSIKSVISVPSVLLLIVVAVLVSRDVIGGFAAMARPTAVVTVNLPRVLEGLEQRAAAVSELTQLADRMRDEDQRHQDEISAMNTELQGLSETDTAAREDLSERAAMRILEYNAWRAFAAEQLDIEKSLRLRNIDRAVKDAIAQLSELNGYDIVLNDDSGQPLTVNSDSKVPREYQVKQKMISRRVLYAESSVDITEELIERMNNAFHAGS
ncbi:MAG: OmpH family outer membrane protein [Phycisphaerales bacterium]|nr:OmpH family outer membrane protein [Phycisphaerae bacterium]NNF42906.1 OmpH family outer membrane protein [Phycisphaerales bacterium]NNM26282.1 OmpH family outer membrane protein [Phycisphaerales bacterium]